VESITYDDQDCDKDNDYGSSGDGDNVWDR
jgi:hypothetical protein